jgi:hypothetical protein
MRERERSPSRDNTREEEYRDDNSIHRWPIGKEGDKLGTTSKA